MWQKSFEIAEVRMFAKNLEAAKKHADEALRRAKEANEHEAAIDCYRLQMEIAYRMRNMSAERELLLESIEYAEANLGPEHPEYAEQLALLAHAKAESAPQEAEELMVRFASIIEESGQNKRTLQTYNAVSEFFMQHDKPELSLRYQQKVLLLTEKVGGKFCEDLAQDIRYYAETLEELGRGEDAETIMELADQCSGARGNKKAVLQILRSVIGTFAVVRR